MAAADDDDNDVLLLVHQLPVDMDGPEEGRLAHLLPPLHRAPPPPPPPPFRRPPPPQAAASAEHRLSFRGWLGAPRHWDLWVAKLRPLHAPLWRRLGIHDAVIASTYRFKRDASSILHLASFWSPETATFAFPWGEATLTLHDVTLIGGFPADGSPPPAPLPPQWRPDEAALNGVRLGFNRSACKKAHHSAWVKHFLTDHNDAVLEHAAFLALWLTRFALPGHPESTMRQAVFPIAVRLARGDRVALAPAVLASLYRDLRDIKAFLVAAASTGDVDGPSPLPIYSPIYILQLWMWERFPALRPARENRLGDGEPVAARWHDLGTRLNPRLVREVLSSGDNFLWQPPYAASLSKYSGWVSSADLSSDRQLRLLAHCLRPCELVGLDCIEQYLPHRVTRQFGLDQDVPGDVPRANGTWVVAWQTYELEGKNVTFFIPQSQPGITVRYAQWWRQQLPPSDLHAGVPAIPVEPKASKRKVKKTPAAMEAEAEKERRMKKARFSPSDKKRKLEELYDAQLSGWLAAGRSGMSDASGGSCKRGSLPKYDLGSDDALLPNVGATNDDVVLLVPRMQTASPAVAVPKKDDTMNPAIVHGGNFIADKPPEIPNITTAMLKEEKLDSIVDRSLDIADKPGGAAVMKSGKEVMDKLNISDISLGITDKPKEGDTAVIKSEKEAMGKLNISVDRPHDITDKPEEGGAMEKLNISVDKSLDITDRPEEGATVVMKSENEAMETHPVPVDRFLDLAHRLQGGAAAMKLKKEAMESLYISADRSLELTDKPEGGAAVMKSGNEDREKLKLSVDRSLDITDKPEGGAAVMKSEKEAMEKLNISVCRSLDITDRLEGDTAIMELQKEVMEIHSVPVDSVSFDLTDRPEQATVALELEKEDMGLSDICEEVTARVIVEKEEEVTIEGDICVVGVNPLENDGEIVMGADEGNKVSEEVGRDAGKSIEAVPPFQQEVDAHVMINSHNAAALPAEALPSQCTRIDGGCSKASYIMEDSNVYGSMCTKDGGTTGRDFLSKGRNEVPCLEEIEGKNKGTVEKDSNEKPQETSQTEIAECVEKTVLVGIYNGSEQKELHAIVEQAVASHSRDTSVLSAGVPETENVEVDKDLNLTKNDAEDMPVEVAGEEVEQEQTNTLEGCAEEEHMEFSDVGHTDMTDPKMHSYVNIETPKKAAKVESADIDNATRLTGRGTDGKIGDVLELGHAEVEDARGLMANISDEKLTEVSQVEHAEEEHSVLSDIDHTDRTGTKMHSYFNTKTPEKAAEVGSAGIDSATILTGRDADANGKIGDVLEVGHAEEAKVRGLIVDASDEKLAEVSQVEHAEVNHAKGLMKEHTNCKYEEVSELETAESEGTHGPMEEDTDGNLKGIHDVNAETEEATEHGRDSDRPKGILQVDQLAKEDIEDDSTKTPQLEYGNLRDAAPIEEDTKEHPCADGNDLLEKDVNESTELSKVKQAEEEGCDLLLEKDDNISDALGVEQAAEGQDKTLTEKDIHSRVEDIALVEQLDGQSESLTRIGTKDISEKITLAHEKESYNDMMIDSKNSTNGETPCRSATVQLKGGMPEKHCVQNVDLINQWEPSSDAAAMKIEGVYDHKTMDMHEDLTQKQNQDHRIIGQNRETTILEGNHMLDSGVKSDLTLEVDETHTAGGIQNQEVSDLDKEIALKQKHDHIIICENRGTIVSGSSHMLDSRVELDSATLEVDETHAGGGIQNKEMFYLDNDHTIICENKGKTAPGAIHMLDSGAKSVSLKVDKTHATEGTENQELLKFETQQGINVLQNLGTAIENNKMSMSEDAGVPLCGEYQIGTAIENSKVNMSEDVGIPVCSENQIDSTASVVNDAKSTKRLQNQELLDNKEQLEIEERQHIGTNNKRNFPGEADILVCDEYQIDSIGTEVKSTKGIQNQEPLDNKNHVMEKRMECELADGSGISLEEASKLGDGADTCAAPVNVSDSKQNREACTIEEATEDKQHHGIEHVNERSLEDRIMIDGELRSDATVVEADMAGSEGMLNQCALRSEETEAAVEEKQDHEMADEDTNRDLADKNELDCEVQPDGAVKMSHVTLLTTEAVDIEGSKVSSENKDEGPFEEYNITEGAGSELNQTIGMEPENLVEVKQENLDETERSTFRENDEASCKDQTSAGVIISHLNVDDQGEYDNRWAEQSTKSYDKLASDSISAASCQPVKFAKSSTEEVKRTQDIRSIYLKDIKESLGRIRAEPSNRVHATNVAYSSRHAVQESHSACKEIKVPLHDSGRDFGRDRALDLVVTSPAEEASRWRQEQYALQILEDVQNARIAEKTRMEMEIRILKAQIASTERRVMNLDHLSEVKSRSKRH